MTTTMPPPWLPLAKWPPPWSPPPWPPVR